MDNINSPDRAFDKLMGLNIKVVDPIIKPKLKLSVDCPVTDKFRKNFDNWLIEIFGYETIEALPKNTSYRLNCGNFGDTLIMNRSEYDSLKAIMLKMF